MSRSKLAKVCVNLLAHVLSSVIYCINIVVKYLNSIILTQVSSLYKYFLYILMSEKTPCNKRAKFFFLISKISKIKFLSFAPGKYLACVDLTNFEVALRAQSNLSKQKKFFTQVSSLAYTFKPVQMHGWSTVMLLLCAPLE